jgi:predicted lipoprotein
VQQKAPTDGDASSDAKTYNVDDYVDDAIALRITPFMLDSYAREYEEMVRQRDAQAVEMDGLRNANRNLSAQV